MHAQPVPLFHSQTNTRTRCARALWPARQIPLATVLLGAFVSAMAVTFIYMKYCAGNRNLDADTEAGGHGRMPV